jgi:hypothetical protein
MRILVAITVLGFTKSELENNIFIRVAVQIEPEGVKALRVQRIR